MPTKIIRIYLRKYQMRLALPVKTQARLMVLRIKKVIEHNACIHYRSLKEKLSLGNSYFFLIFIKADVLETANGTVGNDIVQNDTEIHRRERLSNLSNGSEKPESNNSDLVRIDE